MDIDVQELTRLTNKAIAEGKKKHQEKKQLEIVARAKKIIAEIPSVCKKHAEIGKSKATVMSLKPSEDHNGFVPSLPLKGAAKLVWEACEKARLNPSIERWHDGMGMEGGYNIDVNW